MGGNTAESPSLTADEIYDLLSNRRRRFVLAYLLGNRSVALRELSAELAAWENEISPAAVTSKQRKRVYTALHQTHLIRLDKFGVVDYDRDRGTITATDVIADFEQHLRPSSGGDPTLLRLYGSLGLAAVGLSLAAALGLAGLDGLSPGAIGLVAGSAILAVSLLQARSMPSTVATGEGALDPASQSIRPTPEPDR